MVDFCKSYSPFHVCLTIRLSAHLVYATSHLSFVAFYSYLVCTDRCMVKQTWKGLQLSQKSTICEIGIICACSDHGHPRYQVWIKSNKRQMTSCVHKMCRQTYDGQTNILYRFHRWLIFARVIALFMFVWPYVRLHILCTQLVICYDSRKIQPSVKSV
jgi:hypothetical protein